MRLRHALGLALALLTLGLVPAGCAVSTSFRGPGFTPGRGVADLDPTDPVVVMLTQATLDPGARRPFDENTARLRETMDEQEGLIGASFRKELFGDRLWTMTVWREAADLERFVRSGGHRRAVREGTPALVSTRFLRLELPAGEVPLRWSRALELLADAAPNTYAPSPDPEAE